MNSPINMASWRCILNKAALPIRCAANPLRCWNWFNTRMKLGRDEVTLIARLVMTICESHPVDRQRIYIVGMSAGAAMARLLCVHHSRLFAAAVLHSGVMYKAASSAVDALTAMRRGTQASPDLTAREASLVMGEDSHIVPTLIIHGDEDDVVNPNNAQQHVAQFLALAMARNTPLIAGGQTSVKHGEYPYRLQDFTNDSGLVLRLCMIKGLAHAWSGGDAQHPYNNADGPDASELAWDFMRQFEYNAIPDAVASESLRWRLRKWLRPRVSEQAS